MHYLTISACVKSEDNYIDDFITIHKALGVEHFIFWDRDEDNLTSKFKDRTDITVIKFPEPNRHHESHGILIKNFRTFSRYFALIDLDQVLFSPTNADLKITLQEYEKYAQVQPVWETFGDNGHLTKTPGSVYERFTKRARSDNPINNHTQGIVDPTRCLPMTPPDPHRALVANGQISVDENHRNVGNTPHISPHSQNKLFVAHYISKSLEEWQIKNDKMRSDTGTRMDPGLFNVHQTFSNEVEDLRIKDFWEANCK